MCNFNKCNHRIVGFLHWTAFIKLDYVTGIIHCYKIYFIEYNNFLWKNDNDDNNNKFNKQSFFYNILPIWLTLVLSLSLSVLSSHCCFNLQNTFTATELILLCNSLTKSLNVVSFSSDKSTWIISNLWGDCGRIKLPPYYRKVTKQKKD